jgi:hypothetical protein
MGLTSRRGGSGVAHGERIRAQRVRVFVGSWWWFGWFAGMEPAGLVRNRWTEVRYPCRRWKMRGR